MQALSVLYILENHAKLDKQVYKLPHELDRRVAALKLKAMSVAIDELSTAQTDYLNKA